MLPAKGLKIIGTKLNPNSKKTFKTKKEATIVNDIVNFHGSILHVDVHNSYKSSYFGNKYAINLAAERIVSLKESRVECSIAPYLIHVKINKTKNKRGKEKIAGFPWEIRKKDLKKFPVLFEFSENYQFLGLTIFR